MLIDDSSDTIENKKFAKDLHKAITKIYPINERQLSCWKVWIKVDLEARCTGSFEVLQRTPKDTHIKISVVRLKPYVEASNNHAKQADNASIKEKLTQSTETTRTKLTLFTQKPLPSNWYHGKKIIYIDKDNVYY